MLKVLAVGNEDNLPSSLLIQLTAIYGVPSMCHMLF